MNILTLSTYPINEPLHGGQHRLYNIVQAYENAGHHVQIAGVLGSDVFPKTDNFVVYPGAEALQAYIPKLFLMDEVAIGELFADSDDYFDLLCENIATVPDLIHIEQPWLFQFAKRYVARHADKHIKLLYGSQNIEHAMKYGIVKSYLGVDAAEVASRRVMRCEIAAIMAADATCCVSQHDLDWTLQHTDRACILAPNGVKQRFGDDEGVTAANAITGQRKFALYCASAHPPNMKGFFDMFGAGVGCIAPDETIVIAGSAGPSILADPRFGKIADMRRSCISAGTVSESCLQGLIDTAHAIILPITEGGGTNLKTAEALWSGKHIIATDVAMRGFESFAAAQGLTIATQPEDFMAALRQAMASTPNHLSHPEQDSRKVVLWPQTLHRLVSAISTI